jgi:DNA-binding transcriptional ArsR family regulator
MPRTSGYTPDFLGPPPAASGGSGSAVSFGDELARVRAVDPALAREEIARSLASSPGAAETPRGRAMLEDPARAVRELADVTERAWKALVAPDWPRLRDLLEADIAHRARQLAEEGLEGLFADLRPGLTWSDGTLSVRTKSRQRIVQELSGRGVLLVPSAFIWPDVVSGFAPPWQPTVIYPARGVGGLWQRPTPGSAKALARLLGANRAAVLGELEEPASTTSLAARLGLAPSSVSAHLSALRDAGLLTSRRVHHQVLYERTPLGIALLGGAGDPAGGPALSPDRTAAAPPTRPSR